MKLRFSKDVAWAAGLFEGEGCFSTTKHSSGVYPRASLKTTDLDVLERFHKIVGVGTIVRDNRRVGSLGNKTLYTWRVQNIEGFKVAANMLRPYLGKRRLARLNEIEAERWGALPPEEQKEAA